MLSNKAGLLSNKIKEYRDKQSILEKFALCILNVNTLKDTMSNELQDPADSMNCDGDFQVETI